MLMIWLAHISMYGLPTMMVMALTAVVFAWLGGGWGVLMGQLYIILSVLHMDLDLIPGPVDATFALLCLTHVCVVNLLLIPAWALGVLLRKMQQDRLSRSGS